MPYLDGHKIREDFPVLLGKIGKILEEKVRSFLAMVGMFNPTSSRKRRGRLTNIFFKL